MQLGQPAHHCLFLLHQYKVGVWPEVAPIPKRLPLLGGSGGHFGPKGYCNMVFQITEKGLMLKSLLESVKSIKGLLKIEGGGGWSVSVGSRLVSLDDSVATCQPPCWLQETPWEE